MKILIIEDSPLLAGSIKEQLSKQYVVDVVHTGEEGLYQARSTDYSLMLLDLGLPDINGYEVCQELRGRGVETPILVLSGDRNTNSRVRLLECGADDYVTKPFDSDELQARVGALLRRSKRTVPADNAHMQVDDLIIDVARRSVVRAGIPIRLRRKEFDILQYLVQNQGRTITRDMIFNHVWEAGKEGWNNTIDVHIKHLRDKVDKPFAKKLIKTAYGVGYMVDKTG
jgi:two-component system copper resistance phosphate regulon response regulator CusR